MEIVNQIKQDLTFKFRKGKIDEIIEFLENRLPTENKKYFKLILLINEWKGIENEGFKGTAYHDQLEVRMNRVREKLLKFINKLKLKDFSGFTNENGVIKYKDGRDGQSYKMVDIYGQTWMAQNLNFNTGEECWFYDDNPENEKEFGRLYTWAAAQKACPEGWRLPTVEDIKIFVENLNEEFGFSSRRKAEKIAFLYNSLNLKLGGIRVSSIITDKVEFVSKNIQGRFWTSQFNPKENGSFGKIYKAHYFYLGREFTKFFLNPQGKVWQGHSCRCIKNQ